MAGYNNIDRAYILPSTGMNDAQKASLLQNDAQMESARQQRIYEAGVKRRGDNTKTVMDFYNKETALIPQSIDPKKVADSKLESIKQDLLQNHLGDDEGNLQLIIQEKVGSLNAWLKAANDGVAQAAEATNNFGKVYDKNANIPAVKTTTQNILANALFTPDGELKDAKDITIPDFTTELHKPGVFGSLSLGGQPITDYFNSLHRDPIKGSDYQSLKGYVNGADWDANKTNLNTVEIDPKTGIPTIGIKRSVGADGETILDPEVQKTMMENPNVSLAVAGEMYTNGPAMAKAYVTEKKLPWDATAKENAQGNMLYNRAKIAIDPYVSVKRREVTPKAASVNINNGGGNVPKFNNAYQDVVDAITANGGRPVTANDLGEEKSNLIMTAVNKYQKNGVVFPKDQVKIVNDRGVLKAYNINDENNTKALATFTAKDINGLANPVSEQGNVNKSASETPNKIKVNFVPATPPKN